MEFRTGGDRWGGHRVLEPKGVLPQAALSLDVSLPIFDNEMLISVDRLQLDAASFQQLVGARHAVPVQDQILDIVSKRGKMHNPITNSGGVFLGKIDAVGPRHPLAQKIKKGEEVVSLVSLTLTPLKIEKIKAVEEKTGQVVVDGHAILFESGFLAQVPTDMNRNVVMAALDVCGAPAQVNKRVSRGMKVLIIGLGKAGRASAVQVERMGAKLFGIDASEEAVDWCRQNLCGTFAVCNAADGLSTFEWAQKVTSGQMMDLVINTASLEGTEMGSILAGREGGEVLFFGMNTSFQKAILGAEGVGKNVELVIGNGFVPGHAELMLGLVKSHQPLKKWFEEKFS